MEHVDAPLVRDLAKEDNNEYIDISKDEHIDTEEEDGPNFVATSSDCDNDDE
jgi:hypothetical protein